jgi:hypothetical protein
MGFLDPNPEPGNPDPDPGGQKGLTKIEEKSTNFIFEVLDVLFRGQKASPVALDVL